VILSHPHWLLVRPRRATAIAVGDGSLPAAARGRSWIVAIPPALRALALAAWVIAATGPRLPGGPTSVRREGISIVIALDVSSSMLAEDFAPANRLEVAKRQAIAFIRGRGDDRIGLVAFAGDALTQMPVTLDYAVLEQSVRDLRVGTLEDGTAIGSGLATAVNRLRRVPGTSRVVLLLTDGENNRGAIDPRTAATAAASFGVKVYTVGVGTIGEARIPTGRGLTGFRYELLPVRIDEDLLRDIAGLTGGRYFRATDAESLSRIFQQIDALERTPFDEQRRRRGDERPGPFLFAGLGAFAVALLLAATRVVRAP
jgi:Ca-activated chloride channel family protein